MVMAMDRGRESARFEVVSSGPLPFGGNVVVSHNREHQYTPQNIY